MYVFLMKYQDGQEDPGASDVLPEEADSCTVGAWRILVLESHRTWSFPRRLWETSISLFVHIFVRRSHVFFSLQLLNVGTKHWC